MEIATYPEKFSDDITIEISYGFRGPLYNRTLGPGRSDFEDDGCQCYTGEK